MNTQELARFSHEYFTYNNGNLIWCKGRGRIKSGDIAGNLLKSGYRQVMIKGKNYQCHRIVFLLAHNRLPKYIDHINGNKSDNRVENLRECNNSQNSTNKNKQSNNTSGYKGVFRQGNKWRACIRKDGHKYNLGNFACKHEAAKAYNEAALKYHGEFAYLNIIS